MFINKVVLLLLWNVDIKKYTAVIVTQKNHNKLTVLINILINNKWRILFCITRKLYQWNHWTTAIGCQ